MGRRPKETFLQRHTDCQEAYEKMLNISNYQRNADQNYNEVSPHTGQLVINPVFYASSEMDPEMP